MSLIRSFTLLTISLKQPAESSCLSSNLFFTKYTKTGCYNIFSEMDPKLSYANTYPNTLLFPKIADILCEFLLWFCSTSFRHWYMSLIQMTSFPLHVFMSGLHGLNSTVNVLEMFLVPLLSSQCLQSHWEEGTVRNSIWVSRYLTKWKDKLNHGDSQTKQPSQWSHRYVLSRIQKACSFLDRYLSTWVQTL